MGTTTEVLKCHGSLPMVTAAKVKKLSCNTPQPFHTASQQQPGLGPIIIYTSNAKRQKHVPLITTVMIKTHQVPSSANK